MEELVFLSTMNKGIIYYSRLKTDSIILDGCQKQILKSGLPITSCSTHPIDFGTNVIEPDESIVGYFKRILLALETSSADYVFFCEDDILYHPSHFDFEPSRDDTFYYNTNVWKWNYYNNQVITYDHQASVSGLCVNRKLAIEFYKRRLKIIYENEFEKISTHGNPTWARDMGYEPGKHKGSKEPARAEEWRSEYPIIDIRHTRCTTVPKMTQDSFKIKPVNWQEDVIENLPGWDEPWKLVQDDTDEVERLRKANFIGRKQ